MTPREVRAPRAWSAALIAAFIGLAGLVPAAEAAVKVGKNYRMTSDLNPFRGKDQIGMAVNPNNSNHIVATHANYLTENCEGTASFDGGVTWTPAAVLQPPTAGLGFRPSCRISNHLAEHMYQSVAFGTGNTVYAVSGVPKFSAPSVEEGASTMVFKSTDGGVTWGTGVVAMPGGVDPTVGPYYELSTVAVDPGAGPGGADAVYTAARDTRGAGNGGNASIHTAASTDGGQTFAAPVRASAAGVAIAGPEASSEPVVASNGALTIAWRTSGSDGIIQTARSTNKGATWSAPVDVTLVKNISRAGNSHVTTNLSGGSSFPRMAIDRRNDTLYIVYGQGTGGPTAPAGGYQGADHFIAPDSKVYFQRSLDNGATWSMPKRIDDGIKQPGTPTIQTRHPDINVAPNGRVDIVWEDRRHWYQAPADQGAGERTTGDCLHTHIACDDARLGDTYYAYSSNRGASFSRNIRVSDHSHNNDVGFDYRFGAGWTFGPQAVALGNDKVLIGWMDSREGNFDTDTLDIYLAKVDLNASAAVPQSNVDESDPVALSVALSRRGYIGGGESVLASTFATRNATKVVIVNKDDVAGALAGAVLARANMSTVLLSPAGGLPESVKNEITRMNPSGAYVIGDTSKLSAQVVTDLTGLGIAGGNVQRLSGTGDAGTAADIAARMDLRTPAEKAASVPAFDAAVIANPSGPEGVAAAALAAARRLPVLYVNQGSTPAATSAALSSLNIAKTLVVGGTSQVSTAVLTGLPSAKRLNGSDQYAVSQSVVDEAAARGMPDNIVYVANGARPMDAALLGSMVGRTTGQMVLAPGPLHTTAAGAASAASLFGIDQLIYVGPAASTPPPPPPPPPVAPPPPPPPPAQAADLFPAKMSLARARILRRDRQLDVLAPITSRASGNVKVELHAAGMRNRFTSKVNSTDARIRFRKSIPTAQANMGTGIVTIEYAGDADTRPQTVRLRAASQRAGLTLGRPTISGGRVKASGRISSQARGVVRLQLQYVVDGKTTELAFRGRISNGRWSINEKLSDSVQAAIAKRTGSVHSYTLFTGYLPRRIRGEMRSYQVLGPR